LNWISFVLGVVYRRLCAMIRVRVKIQISIFSIMVSFWQLNTHLSGGLINPDGANQVFLSFFLPFWTWVSFLNIHPSSCGIGLRGWGFKGGRGGGAFNKWTNPAGSLLLLRVRLLGGSILWTHFWWWF